MPYSASISTGKTLVLRARPSRTLTVSNKALTSNVATLTTTTAHYLLPGDSVVVTNVGAPFDGTYVAVAVPTDTTFTYACTSSNVTSVASGGSVVVAQTANLTEWKDSSGTLMLSVNPVGGIITGPYGVTLGKPVANGTWQDTISIGNGHTFNSGASTSVLIGASNNFGYAQNCIGLGMSNTFANGSYGILIGTNVNQNQAFTDYVIGIGNDISLESATNDQDYITALGPYAKWYGAKTLTLSSTGNTAGDGTTVYLQGRTSTSFRRNASIASTWIDSTEATRTSRLTIGTYYTTTAQEAIRIDSASDAARLSFGGVVISGQSATVYQKATGDIALAVRQISSGTGDLTQWQDSTGAVKTAITSSGSLSFNGGAGVYPTIGTSGYGFDFYTAGNGYGTVLRIDAGNNGNEIRVGPLAAATTSTLTVHDNRGFGSPDTRLVVRAGTSQSKNLTEWQNSGGTVLGGVNSAGKGYFGLSSPLSFSGTPAGISASSLAFGASDTSSVITLSRNTNFYGWLGRPLGDYIMSWDSSSGETVFGGGERTGSTQVTITPPSNRVGLVVKGAPSQTTDLQQWQDSTGSTLTKITSDGAIGLGTTRVDGIGGLRVITSNGLLTFSQYGDTVITVGEPYHTPLVLKGASGQAADLQQWQDSNGTVLAKITSVGNVTTIGNTHTFGYNPGVSSNTGATLTPQISGNQGSMLKLDAQASNAIMYTAISGQTVNGAGFGTTAAGVRSTFGCLAANAGGATYLNFSTNGSNTGLHITHNHGSDLLTMLSDGSTTLAGAFVPASASAVPLKVKGAPSQTADLQQWQDSTGAVKLRVTPYGYLVGDTTNGYLFLGGNDSLQGRIYLNYVGGDVIVTPNGGRVAIGNGNTVSGQTCRISTTTASDKVLVVQGAPSHTANLTEWQDSTGAVLAKIASNGSFVVGTQSTSQQIHVISQGNTDGIKLYSGNNSAGGSVNPPSIGFYRSTSGPSVDTNPRFRIKGQSYYESDDEGFGFDGPRSSIVWITGGNNNGFNAYPGGTGFTSDATNVVLVHQQLYAVQGKVVAGIDSNGGTNPTDGYFRSGQRNGAVTDVAGSDLYLQAGRGTGASTTKGNLYFQTPDATTSGTALQSQTTKLTINRNGNVSVNGFSAGVVGLTVKSAPSQTADLQQWQDSTGSILAKIDASGQLTQMGTLSIRNATTGNSGGMYLDSGNVLQIQGFANAVGFPQGIFPGSIKGNTSFLYGDLTFTYGAGTTSYIRSNGQNLNIFPAATYTTLISPGNAASVPLTVKGLASQTADLQQWQNSSGTIRLSVASDYNIYFSDLTTGSGATNRGQSKIGSYWSVGTEGSQCGGLRLATASPFGGMNTNADFWSSSGGTSFALVIGNSGSGTIYTQSNSTFAVGDGTVFPLSVYTNAYSGTPYTVTLTGVTTCTPNAASVVPLIVKGAPSQTNDLLQLQDSTGSLLAFINNLGELTCESITTGGITCGAVNVDTDVAVNNGVFCENLSAFDANLGAGSLLVDGESGTVTVPNLTITNSLIPASLANSSASSGSIYYSTTGGYLAYKNSGGTVVNLEGGGGGGSGTVTSVSVVTANGVSGSVANDSTTPAITLSLGAITPSSVASSGNISVTNGSATIARTGTGTPTVYVNDLTDRARVRLSYSTYTTDLFTYSDGSTYLDLSSANTFIIRSNSSTATRLTLNASSLTTGVAAVNLTGANTTITPATTAGVPLTLKALSSQSGNLLELQDSTNTALSYVDNAGRWNTFTAVVNDGSARQIGQFLSTTTAAANTGADIGFGGLYNGSGYVNFAYIGGRKENATSSDYAGYMTFLTRTNGNTPVERARISSAGYFCINTTTTANSSVNYHLNIDSGASDRPIRITSNNPDASIDFTNTGTGGRRYNFGSTNSSSGAGAGFIIYDESAGLAFCIRDTERKVGITTATPGAQFHVTSTGSSVVTAMFQAAASQTANSTEWRNSSSTAYVTVGPPALTGSSQTSNFFNITATMPSTMTSQTLGVVYNITGAGNSSQANQAFRVDYLAGYTGSSLNNAGAFINRSAGTGNNFNSFSATNGPSANVGMGALAYATTTGMGIGAYGQSEGANVAIGVLGSAVATKNSATNIGVLGIGLNGGTSPIQVGGYFGLQSSTPTFASAALMADNGGTTSDILVLRDNGTTTLNVMDGGYIFSTTTLAASSSNNISVRNTSNNAAAQTRIQLYNDGAAPAEGVGAALFLTSTTHATLPNTLGYWNYASNGNILFATNNTERVRISSAGQVTFANGITLASLADASAANSSLYYSTTGSYVAWKNSAGSVVNLEATGGGSGGYQIADNSGNTYFQASTGSGVTGVALTGVVNSNSAYYSTTTVFDASTGGTILRGISAATGTTAGVGISLIAGAASGGGNGGGVSINGGNGVIGGSVSIASGNGTGSGSGSVSIATSSGGAAGGGIYISTAAGSATSGLISIATANAANSTGSIDLSVGNASSGGGGSVSLTAGNGNTSSNGGSVNLEPGQGGAINIKDHGGTVQSAFDDAGRGFPCPATFVLAEGAAATTGTNRTNGIVIPRDGKIVKAFIYAKTAPTGAALIVDINVNGTSIWATNTGNRLQLTATTTSGNQTSFDTTTVTEGQVLTIDIDQVGSTVAGQDITVVLFMLMRNQ